MVTEQLNISTLYIMIKNTEDERGRGLAARTLPLSLPRGLVYQTIGLYVFLILSNTESRLKNYSTWPEGAAIYFEGHRSRSLKYHICHIFVNISGKV